MFTVVWTPATLSPTDGKETDFYGGRQISIGGPVALISQLRSYIGRSQQSNPQHHTERVIAMPDPSPKYC